MGDSRSEMRVRWMVLAMVAAVPWWGAGCRPHPPSRPEALSGLQLTSKDRVLVLAPHPDDEVLGCAGVIQDALALHLPLRIVFFTYGDNNQWSFLIYRKRPVLIPSAVRGMGLIRHDEALAAAATLGISPEHLTFLGYPDFGTLDIWKSHWANQPAFRSMLTRVQAVPYANALRPGAPYKGEEVLRDLTAILREFRPTRVFVSHPADHMPDHTALYLFTRIALWDLAEEIHPSLHPYLVHFGRWPRPKGFHPSMLLQPPASLTDTVAWQSRLLRPEQIAKKQQALRAHRSQFAYSANSLRSFVRLNELFGDFPVVRLPANTLSAILSPDGSGGRHNLSEELTDVERAAFVGVETRSVHLEGATLVLSITFSRPLANTVKASIYVFGYRADRAFAQLPKLHIKLRALHATAYDQQRPLPAGTIQITRTPTRLVIRVPLVMLGEPQRILTGARTSLGEVPLDWTSWRVLDVAPDGG